MVWAAEMGHAARQWLSSVTSISSPLDLAASGHAIGRGLNRWIYTPYFLRSMLPKARAKWHQHPGLFDVQALSRVRDLYDFDQVFTAPLHGFHSTDDYWRRASAKPKLRDIRIPALLVNAINDPFIPACSLPTAADISSSCQLIQTPDGGHVGYVSGLVPPGRIAVDHLLKRLT
jgi:predicted alpha/beta-fold hydrolase